MKCFQYSDKDLLQAFMKTAQYLAGLAAHEDVWRHIAELMVNFYRADSAGFARRLADGEIEIHHLITSDRQPSLFLSSKEIQETASEVFDTGFLAWRSLGAGEESYTVVLLPVAIGADTSEVLLVGDPTAGPVANDVLNVYLAVAGLAGAAIARVHLRNRTEKAPRSSPEAGLGAHERTHLDPGPPGIGDHRAHAGRKGTKNDPGPPGGAG